MVMNKTIKETKMFKNRGQTVIAGVSLLVILVIVVVISMVTARGEPTDTYHSSWRKIRASAAQDGDNFSSVYDLNDGGGNFASKDTSTVADGGAYQIRSRGATSSHSEGFSIGGAWLFSICGVGEPNDVFSFNIVGWGKSNGMAQIIAEGNGSLGTQDVVIYPGGAAVTDGFWADTITLDETTKWPSVTVVNSGDNEVACILADTTGLEWIQFVVYDSLGSEAGEANSTSVYGRRY